MACSLPGCSNPNAGFTPAQVREIRAEWARGKTTCIDLAKRYEVHLRTMYGIVRGETYQDPEYRPPPNTERDTKKGERHPRHLLSESDVKEIKRMIAERMMTLTAIGERFGVSRSHVGGIKRGRFWRHVKP